MPFSTLVNRRALAFFGVVSLGGSYMLMKTRAITAQREQRQVGDYSVSTTRSGGGI
ncbi:hypothetical protein EJ05DRAFT_479470 [Pseudovirgaria hyperparasitica]|uniref:Uncharacterized protein n=1 Tax=Pseudovirgaria hyperparasitica TaxID=470096 RepID=A0A6A6VXS8_9PEZI|nr:uncharacterized protein EJ05DRAFT_479470 [Pseudovirgaria hyperparasitica]KAF2754494.1 hypothetical protein EJ05DRAFT_479470 [Pseudovirgaria hyperparasitica]